MASENNDMVGFFNWTANWIRANRPERWCCCCCCDCDTIRFGKSVTFVCRSSRCVAASTNGPIWILCKSSCVCCMHSCSVVALRLLFALNAESCAVEMGSCALNEYTTNCSHCIPRSAGHWAQRTTTNNTAFPKNGNSFWHKWWCDNDTASQLPTNIYDLVSPCRHRPNRRSEWIVCFIFYFISSPIPRSKNEPERCQQIQIQIDWSPLGCECILSNPAMPRASAQKDSFVILQIDSKRWPLSSDTMHIQSIGWSDKKKESHSFSVRNNDIIRRSYTIDWGDLMKRKKRDAKKRAHQSLSKAMQRRQSDLFSISSSSSDRSNYLHGLTGYSVPVRLMFSALHFRRATLLFSFAF